MSVCPDILVSDSEWDNKCDELRMRYAGMGACACILGTVRRPCQSQGPDQQYKMWCHAGKLLQKK